MAGPFVLGIVFYRTTQIRTDGSINDNIFVYIFPMLGLIGIFISKIVYRKLLRPLGQKDRLSTKLAGLQAASLISYALVEGPALLNIVWFSQTGNLLYLTVGAVLIIYLFTVRPKKEKVVNDLRLSNEHKKQFDSMDTPM